jgi:hypothetical protein
LALYATGSQCVDELPMRDLQCTRSAQIGVPGCSRGKRNGAAAEYGRKRESAANEVQSNGRTPPPSCGTRALLRGTSRNTQTGILSLCRPPGARDVRHAVKSGRTAAALPARIPRFGRLTLLGPAIRQYRGSRHHDRAQAHRPAFLILPIPAVHRLQQLLGVIADAILEDDFHVLDIRDAGSRITFHHNEVRVLAN